MRIGIYGGTFSPVHNGHVIMAKSFFEQMKLDKLYVIPTYTPPHKIEDMGASVSDRFEMLKLAFEGFEGIIVSDIEIRRKNVSYTIDTLRELVCEGELYLLCGSDMFLTLETWREASEIFKLAHIVLGRREADDSTKLEIEKQKEFLNREFSAEIHELEFPALEISSSEIRELISQGKTADKYLPESVVDYITRHGLYRHGITDERLEEIREYLRFHLSKHRLEHTLAVEREIVRLAEIFAPEKKQKLRVAAILHDITKEFSVDRHIELCKTYGLCLTRDSECSPKLFHALTGAYFARTLFEDAVDDEIFDAILYHTTGRERMTLADMLLYLADYIEDTRTFKDCVILRNYFYEGIYKLTDFEEKYMHLQKTLLLSFDMTIKNLRTEGATISGATLAAMDYIKEEIENKSGRRIIIEEL